MGCLERLGSTGGTWPPLSCAEHPIRNAQGILYCRWAWRRMKGWVMVEPVDVSDDGAVEEFVRKYVVELPGK